jgi:hypothetical protein
MQTQLENTIILTQQCSQQQEKKTPHSADIFNTIMNYPIPREAQRYPKPSNPELLGYNTFQSPSQIHDIITVNLTSLVPNIHIGYQMEIPANDLIEWIKKTQEYANNLNKEFQEKCEKKMQQLINIEEQTGKCKVLNMDNFNRLPEDILIHIHGYLMPETRIEIIKSRCDKREYKYIKLSNEMRCILISDPEADKSAASLDVKVGCSLDPKPLFGTAHFLEHMLF